MPKPIFFKKKYPCYNGLLSRHGKYLYSSRSGQIWKTDVPEDVNSYFGDPDTDTAGVWYLSQDRATLTAKNNAAIMSNKYANMPTVCSIAKAFENRTNKTCTMLVVYNNKYYWLYKEILYEVKWIRSTATEYLMLKNFSNA
jgi:hypothetical protein